MNWIKLSINNGEMNGVLELDKLSNENKAALISGFFKAFGVDEVKSNVSNVSATVNVSPAKFDTSECEKIIPLTAMSNLKEAAAKLTSSLAAQATQLSKDVLKPPLLNSERNLSVPLGEKLAAAADAAKEQPEWWTTGIKYRDGVPHYRCRNICKSCQAKGNDYIKLDESEVTCRSCGQKLAVRLATGEYEDFDKMIPERDNWGNFFIADHPVME
ncbi:hypothetical protein [Paenibacillus alvei]|uniref:hypothetical protein n=1 Tax=Paenibacillus alvei TaxID=44250 RepID=UPI0013D982A5|nr:hypothetical protein [Paenibacillus alvei]NEZ41388.1 hypothetical protein [Paenibacillus alvei]